jgi:hypothetical protein
VLYGALRDEKEALSQELPLSYCLLLPLQHLFHTPDKRIPLLICHRNEPFLYPSLFFIIAEEIHRILI